jgi:S-adenosylmethionine:tRNA-ribosyltransferase-isomerase (queuine synthetase)
MKKSDFNYRLPDELIARYPLDKRVDSRLLVVNDEGFFRPRFF